MPLLLCNQNLLKLFWKSHESRLPGMATIHLEVLQTHFSQHGYDMICEIPRVRSLNYSPGCMIVRRGEKSRLRSPDQQQKGNQGLQHKAAGQDSGVIFSSHLIPSVNKWQPPVAFRLSQLVRATFPSWMRNCGKDARKLSCPDNRNLTLGVLKGYPPSLVRKYIHFLRW